MSKDLALAFLDKLGISAKDVSGVKITMSATRPSTIEICRVIKIEEAEELVDVIDLMELSAKPLEEQ